MQNLCRDSLDGSCEFGACRGNIGYFVQGQDPKNPSKLIEFGPGSRICGDFICGPKGKLGTAAGGGATNLEPGPIFTLAGGLVGAADITAGESGVLFGTVKNGYEGGGLFNRGDYFRLGWSHLRSGGARFRIGGKGIGHINLWPPSWWFGPPPGR